ncbi:MAG: efflux RND transporter periplasmic adaptor subunit [Planctomycetes bacterium]|nr:efflux RND transporter periplasmic adaptor subunit [Planctomycetota bacterium]
MPVTKVVVVEAQMLEAPATITLVGTVHPVRRSRVASEIAGLVDSVPARQGDLVLEGDTLCKLRDDTLTLELVEAEARLEALNARHEELLTGTRSEDLRRLAAMRDEAAADQERWKLENQRVGKLYEGSESNAKELYDTRADFHRAQSRMIAAQAVYDLALAGPRDEVIAEAAYEAAAQQAVVFRVESALRKTAIPAPYTSYVVERTVEIGEWVPIGGQVAEVVDLATVLVRVDAPESIMPYLVVGEPARVAIDALGKTFEGSIRHVIRQADATARTFPVEIELDNRDGRMAAGMFARVTLPAGPKERVVAVPKDAIVERDGTAYVAMTMPGKHGGMVGLLMPVTTGGDVGDWIAITSGNVRPGMALITRGNEHILPFPTPVQIVNDRGTPVPMPPRTTAAQGPKSRDE